MEIQELGNLLTEILVDLKSLEAIRGTSSLHSIISSYEDALAQLSQKSLNKNSIEHSPREYLEIYSDYENPLLERMDIAQRKFREFIDLEA